MIESDDQLVIQRTARWIDRVVIGLNLCPFARAVQVKQQIRYVVSVAEDVATLQDDLARELRFLATEDATLVETTVLIHPRVLHDFLDYNDFLSDAEELLDTLGLSGELQLASFHPDYRFAGSAGDDPANSTNRSPYPMLHLLRESSVSRAVETFGDTTGIYERNVRTLRELPPGALERLKADED